MGAAVTREGGPAILETDVHAEVIAVADALRALIITGRRALGADLGRLLERRGCQVVVAGDGKSAVDLFQAQHQDMVLVDTRVEGAMDFAAQVRARPSAPLLIAVSSEALRNDERRRLAAAGFVMIILTTDPSDLAVLSRLVLRREAGPRLASG